MTNPINQPAPQSNRRGKAKRIPGGIKPLDYKASALRSRIMPTPIPEQLLIPIAVKSTSSSAARINVKAGENVLKYQLLGVDDRGNNIHAPTSGQILGVCDSQLANQVVDCIQLEADQQDQAIEIHPSEDYKSLQPYELIEAIKQAGIRGMGGAGFPSWKKLRLAQENSIETLIINAAECEPFISCDQALIRERASEIIVGAEILQAACSAKNCVIAIEDNMLDAIQSLEEAMQQSAISLLKLSAKYPAGGEKQLIQAVTGMEVPSGELPVRIGVSVHNVGTSYAVYRAIVKGEPCISRITTVTGSALQTPKNFEALIGTPVSLLFKLCGIDETLLEKTVLGGSLMGIVLNDEKTLVDKTTNCLIATTKDEFPSFKTEQACIRCGYCADACPSNLLPQQLYSFSRSANHQQLNDHGLFDCIECGACAYVCPSHIPLVQYYRASKSAIEENLAQQQLSSNWESRFQYHQYRIKKEAEAAKNRKPAKRKLAEEESVSKPASLFSRDKARAEIANAVARVKARKAQLIASEKTNGEEES